MSQQVTTRSRSLPLTLGKGRYKSYWDYADAGSPYQDRNEEQPFGPYLGTQLTTSEGHPFRKNRNPGYDVGGNFDTLKSVVEIVGNPIHHLHTTPLPTGHHVDNWAYYDGPILSVNPTSVGFPPNLADSTSAMHLKGTTAISRSSPTNPVANLSTALGELYKDHLPAIPGIRSWEVKARLLANAGDEFLNVVFGWKPLLADIRTTAKAVAKSQAVLRQFERDAGKVVRRGYVFDTEVSESTDLYRSNTAAHFGEGYTDLNEVDWTGRGDVYLTRRTVKRTWFSGAFTYHLPTDYNSRKSVDRAALEAKKVFGLSLTPETLWNLSPWSWALDWVSNTGDVLQNISALSQYGQVLRYGYVMHNCVTTDTYSWRRTSGPRYYGGEVHVPLVVMKTESKSRRGANPFGFGLTLDSLDATQKAIIAALGLSKLG